MEYRKVLKLIATIIIVVASQLIVMRESPAYVLGALLTLEMLIIVWTGADHAYVYAHYIMPNDSARGSFIRKYCELHFTQVRGEFATFALLWFAGVQGFLIYGAQLLIRVVFQGLINWATNKPFVDPNEAKTWGLGDRLIPKFLPGNFSYLKLLLGLILVVAGFLVEPLYSLL